jgi:hypothetical protein
MNPQLDQAIQNLRLNSVRYSKTERYYTGDHDIAFATEKFQSAFGSLFRQFALNLCPAICDAIRDKLKITGFGVQGKSYAFTREAARSMHDSRPQSSGDITPKGVTLTQMIDHIWRLNRMSLRSGEIHKEALKNGDAYAIVWFGPDGEPAIYPQRAASCTVQYDEEDPGRIAWAAKQWRSADGRTRLNLFYPDRIERYITRKAGDSLLPDAKDFVEFGLRSAERGMKTAETETGEIPNPHSQIPNPFNVVPVFHFANNADVGQPGQSELKDAVPIQDGLNKSVLDMLVAMEYSAFRQRWVAGIELQMDETSGQAVEPYKAGIDRLWVASAPEARFGDFSATDLEQFLKVKDSFRVDMASVTGTPLHYFLQNTRGFASGEALRKVETRFLAKVRDRQESFGQTWADLMSFALRLAGHDGVELITNWDDPAPIADSERLQSILLKKQLGVSTEQALKEAGYGELDIRRMLKE